MSIKSRMQMKYGTFEEWSDANIYGFTPLKGEIIVYEDGEGGESNPKIKVGDGEHSVDALPFCEGGSAISLTRIEEICQ